MLKINVICVGKIKENYFKDAVQEYSKRLSKYCNLDIIEVEDEKLLNNMSESDKELIRKEECEKIKRKIPKGSFIFVLDLRGKQFSSEEFASKINNIAINENSNITFIIGGSLGLTEEIINLSNINISFSKMTFPHQLMRVFLLEQIFRSFKILKNEKYHW